MEEYQCQKCKNDCGQVYRDNAKKKWICEVCWISEQKEMGIEVDDEQPVYIDSSIWYNSNMKTIRQIREDAEKTEVKKEIKSSFMTALSTFDRRWRLLAGFVCILFFYIFIFA